MTNEEMAAYLRQLRLAAQINALLEGRRRELLHQEYRKMGFEVDTMSYLKRQPYIDVKSRFVDVDSDFYENK